MAHAAVIASHIQKDKTVERILFDTPENTPNPE